ncbi:hypothetical protein QUF64_07770 [Anaerolineales bacterium HSG6]|nr:hypothetical protein [Anaerolineales bacterium HSG6]
MKITLTKELGRGGEATVYNIADQADMVAKIYHQPTPEREAKLRAMLLNPPEQPSGGHVAIAWPTALLYKRDSGLYAIAPNKLGTTNGRFVGFLMPKISGGRAIFNMYNPALRKNLSYPFDWRALHRTAYNLCAVVSAIHTKGYVIGDINESNILVNREALVTIVDCDSFQVTDEFGNIHRCQVGKPEYTPPELQGVQFKTVDQSAEHDLFGLGVLLFQLLMEGFHPFAGVLKSGASVGRVDLYAMRQGLFPHGDTPSINPPPAAPEFDWLNPQIQQLFKACFELGHGVPSMRPNGRDWQSEVQLAENGLTRCSQGQKHWYGQHLAECPHCYKAEQILVQTGTTAQSGDSIVPSLEGTRWGGIDHDEFHEYRFLPNGVLYFISSKTGGTPNCSWRQNKDKIYMSMNNKYSECEGIISGNRMSGKAWNRVGAQWTWEAEKGVTSAPKASLQPANTKNNGVEALPIISLAVVFLMVGLIIFKDNLLLSAGAFFVALLLMASLKFLD